MRRIRVYSTTATLTSTPVSSVSRGLAPNAAWLAQDLKQIDSGLEELTNACPCKAGLDTAHRLSPLYRQTLDLRAKVAAGDLDAQAKASLLFELDAKIAQFESALEDVLGLELTAFRTNESKVQEGGFRGNSAEETAAQRFSRRRIQSPRPRRQASRRDVHLEKTWFENPSKEAWKHGDPLSTAGEPPVSDAIYSLKVPEDAERPSPSLRGLPSNSLTTTSPIRSGGSARSRPILWRPGRSSLLTACPFAWAELCRRCSAATGRGGYYEPLVVTPALGVSVDPEARILPLNGGTLPVKVTVHTQGAAEGTVSLKLPEGWRAEPAEAQFKRTAAGDTEPILFSVTPSAVKSGAYTIAGCGPQRRSLLRNRLGQCRLPGIDSPTTCTSRPQLETRKVDVKLAPGLRIGYVMGTGDLVPQAIEELGAAPQLLSDSDLTSGDLSNWNVIVIGIRAYSNRPVLTAVQPRLDEFVRNGGTLIVQYQSGNFPAPFPLAHE